MGSKIVHSVEFVLSGSFADVGFFRHFNLVLIGGGGGEGLILKNGWQIQPPLPPQSELRLNYMDVIIEV